MTYLINLIFIIIYYFIFNVLKCNKDKRDKCFICVAGVHIILFRALADPYNYVDTQNYVCAFEYISRLSLSEVLYPNSYSGWGQGFVFFNWLLSRLSNSYLVLYVGSAIISISCVLLFYYKTSNNVLFSLVIFLVYPMMYYQGFGVLRHHIAIPLSLLVLYYWDNYKVSIPLMILCISMHTSMLVFVPFFIWYRYLKNKTNVKRILLYVVGLAILLRSGIVTILSYFERYSSRLEGSADSNIVPVLILGSFLIMVSHNNLLLKINNEVDNRIVHYCFYGFSMALFSMGVPAMGRLSNNFIYIIPVAITLLNKYNGNRLTNNLYLAFILTITFTMCLLSVKTKGYEYIMAF